MSKDFLTESRKMAGINADADLTWRDPEKTKAQSKDITESVTQVEAHLKAAFEELQKVAEMSKHDARLEWVVKTLMLDMCEWRDEQVGLVAAVKAILS